MKGSFSSLLIPALLISACSGTPDPIAEPETSTTTEEVTPSDTASSDQNPQTGNYVGMFVAKKTNDVQNAMQTNKINLVIDSISGSAIWGHSIVAGNKRPWKGTIKNGKNDDSYVVEGKEPGDDKYDGTFTFTHFPKEGIITGEWKANNKNLAVSERSYRLNKVRFQYNKDQALGEKHLAVVYNSSNGEGEEAITPDAGKFNASNTRLKASDVENMYKRDLEVMRNAIYARHGYSFKNRQMRNFFDHVDWYIPVSIDITNDLTPLEKENIALLKRYEQHATTYYDVFGR